MRRVWLILILMLCIQVQIAASQSVDRFLGVSVSPDGQTVIGFGNRGLLQGFDYATGTIIFQPQINTSIDYTDISWRPDGRQVATSSSNGLIYIWCLDRMQTPQCNLGEVVGTLMGHEAEVLTVAWSPSGQYIVSGSQVEQNNLRLWNAINYSLIAYGRFGDPIDIAWSPDSGSIAIAQMNGSPVILSVTGNNLSENRTVVSNRLASSVAWSPSGRWIAFGNLYIPDVPNLGEITIWDAQDNSEETLLVGHTEAVNSLTWSPDGSQLASIGFDRTIRIWNALDWQQERLIVPPQGETLSLYGIGWNYSSSNILFGGGENDPPLVSPTLNTIILSPTPANPLTLSEETRAWYNYTITLSAPLTGSECVTVRLDTYPPTPSNYAHVQTRVVRDPEIAWSTAQTLVFDANHTDYEVRIRARDDSTNLTGAVGRLGHRIIENTASGCTSAAGFVVNTVDVSGMRLTGSPFNGGNDASAAADSRNVLVFTVADND